jgi:lipopolysaccharide heptosyltransferase I
MNVLLVRLSAMGDIVHTVPLAVALRRHRPGVRIDWLVDRRYAVTLDLFDAVDRVITVDPTGAWRATVGVVRALRRSAYDAVIDAQGLLKSAILARLAGGARTIGYAREALREPAAARFYTETVSPDRTAHIAQQNLSLLTALGIETAAIETPVRAVASAVADEVLRADGPRFGILNPGAGWPNKQWPPERFGEVARVIAERHGLEWIVVWGPGEEALARRVEESSSGSAMMAPPTTLTDLMALIERAAIVVAGDTGPIHLAAAAGTPVVGLYGPTNPARNGPWSPHDVTLSRFDVCQCHHKRRCTAPNWCLGTIGVDDVVAAIEKRLRP